MYSICLFIYLAMAKNGKWLASTSSVRLYIYFNLSIYVYLVLVCGEFDSFFLINSYLAMAMDGEWLASTSSAVPVEVSITSRPKICK